MAALEEPDTRLRRPEYCVRRLDGKPAAATTTRRKRAVCANALGYAVERRLQPANPLGQIQWKVSEVAEAVDRRRRQPSPGRETPEGRLSNHAHISVICSTDDQLRVICTPDA